MAKMPRTKNSSEETYTYRYILKLKNNDENLSVQYYTGTIKQHLKYRSLICKNDDVESCIAEYVCSYHIAFVGTTFTVKEKEKEKEKENKEHEEIC